ncbi:ABC transporter ATP-binding protein [Brevibacillus marinus]|uniref:ABC transporter ATP-binding protein n=1 Tax=Brevibacillus marinus TaxID=2496837 RepID=UPI000F82E406|nr:ABC transporter ATP-binding protein [Brevibacillus marinus]
MILYEVKDVTAGYIPGINILNGANLQARKGEITVILGANGAGKSTLLKTMYGFLNPRQGEVRFRGQLISGFQVESLLKMGIAYVPQQSKSLFPDMTVQENLEMGCWVIRQDKSRVKQAIERVYERHGFLRDARHLPAGLMSGGQQRILELERALLTEPEVMLLDEPTETLSPKIAKEIYKLLEELKTRGVTVILIDQNVKSSVQIADYIYILDLGRTKHHGSKAEIAAEMENIIKSWIAVEEVS